MDVALLDNVDDIEPLAIVVTRVTDVYTEPNCFGGFKDLAVPGDELVANGRVGHWYRLVDGGGYISSLDVTRADDVSKPESTAIWRVSVTGSGAVEVLDQCTGGLTHLDAFEAALGIPFYGIHHFCAGEPARALAVGDSIEIDGQAYNVIDVTSHGLAGNANDIFVPDGADALLYTACLVAGETLIIGLARA
jgi:hypothetical protein